MNSCEAREQKVGSIADPGYEVRPLAPAFWEPLHMKGAVGEQ